jgi:hypothetical protein
MRIQILRGCFAPDAGGGDGGDGGDGETGKVKPSEVLTQYGGQTAEAALRMAERVATLMNDNYTLRRKNGEYKTEVETLRGKAAPEGAIVLSADDAKAWEAYKAIGKPDDLTKAVTDRDAAQAELQKLRHEKTLTAAAEAHGYRAAALGKLPSLAGKAIEMREVEIEGAKVPRAFVKDGDKETGLTEYITAHDPELLPALSADAVETRKGGGISYPAQPGNGGKPAAVNAAKSYIKKTNYAIPGKKGD